MNVLLLSAGRRVELTKLLRESVHRLNGKLLCADGNLLSPALFFADQHFQLPMVSDDNYIQELIDNIVNYDISIIIPTIDTELTKLSYHQAIIESNTNAKLILSKTNVIEMFSDKKASNKLFTELGFDTPNAISELDIAFPVFAKPIYGSSSIGAQQVNSKEELTGLIARYGEIVLQESIIGQEYTIDCLLDVNGNPVHIVPRLRIATRAGEILKGKVVRHSSLIEQIKLFLSKVQFYGPITIQVIESNNRFYFIEVNPRLGGGVPMSIYAGASILDDLLLISLGDSVPYRDSYRDGVIFLRYDQSVEMPIHND